MPIDNIGCPRGYDLGGIPARIKSRDDVMRLMCLWAHENGTVEGLRRIMIGRSRFSAMNDVMISICKKSDTLTVKMSGVSIKIPETGYNKKWVSEAMEDLRLLISPDWEAVMSGVPDPGVEDESFETIEDNVPVSKLMGTWNAR